MRKLAGVALLGVLFLWGDVFDEHGRRVATVKPTSSGSHFDIFDGGRRVGWGRCQAGSCELFGNDGRRIGEVRGGRVIIYTPLRHKR